MRREVGTFLLVGAGCTLAQYLFFAIGIELGVQPAWMGALSYALAGVIGFFLNYHMTFRCSNHKGLAAMRFMGVVLLGTCLTKMLMSILLTWIPAYAALVLATGVTTLSNFLLYKFFAFANERR